MNATEYLRRREQRLRASGKPTYQIREDLEAARQFMGEVEGREYPRPRKNQIKTRKP